MSRNRWFLGIDTSAYTTSVALVDAGGRLIADERLVLQVPAGQRGLRQSEALFQHVRHLPQLMDKLPAGWGRWVEGVAASESPRPVTGSYMPVFLAGLGAARQIASALGVPYLGISHQEGHLWAGLWSAQGGERLPAAPESFLAYHVSGGTTELLYCRPSQPGRIAVAVTGGTEDLTAGQMIDRIGVAMGLPFPAGPALERLAAQAGTRPEQRFRLPVSARGERVSFSGPASAAQRALERGADRAQVAAAVEECVATSLIRLLEHGCSVHPGTGFLLAVGGVMANGTVRRRLQAACVERGMTCVFAAPRYSVDNAVGVAVAAALREASRNGMD